MVVGLGFGRGTVAGSGFGVGRGTVAGSGFGVGRGTVAGSNVEILVDLGRGAR